MTSFIGMVGTPESESFGFAFDDFSDVGFISVGWQLSNAEDFVPYKIGLEVLMVATCWKNHEKRHSIDVGLRDDVG